MRRIAPVLFVLSFISACAETSLPAPGATTRPHVLDIAPVSIGAFANGLAGRSLADTLKAELKSAGKLSDAGPLVLTGMVTAEAPLSARITLTRGAKVTYEKAFTGQDATAIAAALFADPAFKAAAWRK